MYVCFCTHIHVEAGSQENHTEVQIVGETDPQSFSNPVPLFSTEAISLQVPPTLIPCELSPLSLLTQLPFQSFPPFPFNLSELTPVPVLWAGQCSWPWTGTAACPREPAFLQDRMVSAVTDAKTLSWQAIYFEALTVPQRQTQSGLFQRLQELTAV